MATWRSLGVLMVALIAASPGRTQTYTLSESPQAGDCFRIHLDMKLAGEIRVPGADGMKSIPLAATAADEYSERSSDCRAQRLPSQSSAALRCGQGGHHRRR